MVKNKRVEFRFRFADLKNYSSGSDSENTGFLGGFRFGFRIRSLINSNICETLSALS